MVPAQMSRQACSLTNQSYWEINNLEVTNLQKTGSDVRLCGILVKSTEKIGVYHICVQNCYVHDVNALTKESNTNFSKGSGGIIFNGYTNDVLIKGCRVKNVAVEGIRNNSDPEKSFHFVIDSNLVENVYGDGIVLHGVKGHSAITRNVLKNTCYNTGAANYAGAWTYLSDTTLVAYNEVSEIKGGGRFDGEAFDADINTNGDIFEYNYSHDNANGFMLFMSNARNIIVRYNISVDDVNNLTDTSNAKKLFFFEKSANSANRYIYNNTFYVKADIAYLFRTACCGTFTNNIFYCVGTVNHFCSSAVNPLSGFYNNCLYPQAMILSNGPATGDLENIYEDPRFVNAGFHGGGISGGVRAAYVLSSASSCRQSGKSIANNGGYDYAGNNIMNSRHTAMGAIWPRSLRKTKK